MIVSGQSVYGTNQKINPNPTILQIGRSIYNLSNLFNKYVLLVNV